MYFADLTGYSYGRESALPTLLNVGWLSPEHTFQTSEPTRDLVDALWLFCEHPVRRMRGYHECQFCGGELYPTTATFDGVTVELGSAEIRVFSPDGPAYAAPNLIFHFVTEHYYAPPDAFVDAAVTGPRPGSAEYKARLGRDVSLFVW